ncbi:hypothetical protein GCM10011328_19510 [Hafnia psychrotolerans]|uniref:Uncharacterized protein n=1 Tax=Hafnia psychrotolerans TaxID=1477018 RepID=A0ABQ1GIF4_9GAMM|nr:hypothetical protein GCM10011328_19510 [Hafnia psychrotolerans]
MPGRCQAGAECVCQGTPVPVHIPEPRLADSEPGVEVQPYPVSLFHQYEGAWPEKQHNLCQGVEQPGRTAECDEYDQTARCEGASSDEGCEC